MITIGSLCSGYGGLDRAAVAALGGPGAAALAWHAEVDSDAIKVHDQHWPGLANVTDVREARWRTWERPDALVMGPPCQPVSAAGRQMAQDDPRWLWPAAHRAVRDLGRPPLVFFENVRGLISIKGGEIWRGILADLRALGYACRWLVLGACAVGAPHHRHRVFMLARQVGAGAPLAVRIDVQTCGARRGHPFAMLPTPRAADGTGDGRIDLRIRPEGSGSTLPTAVRLLPTPRASDGHSRAGSAPRNNRGEPLLPNVAALFPLLPTPRASDAKNGGPNQGIASGDVALSSAVIGDRWGKYAPAVRRWVPVVGRPAPEPTEVGPRGGLRLASALPEWMMGLADGYLCDHVERNAALRLAGNGVVPLQGYHAFRILLSA